MQLIAAPGVTPVELVPVQATGAQPDTQAIVDQRLHAVAPAVGEQIRAVRPGGAEHLDHPGQGLIRPGGPLVVEWPAEQAHQCLALLRELLQ